MGLSDRATENGGVVFRRRTTTARPPPGVCQAESVRVSKRRVRHEAYQLSRHHRRQWGDAAELAPAFWSGGNPSADRLRQCRKPAARPGGVEVARNGDPPFNRRRKRPAGAAIADRKRPGFAPGGAAWSA